MKAALLADLLSVRRVLVQTVLLMVAVSFFVAFTTENLTIVGAIIAAFLPFNYVINCAAYDESNNWESYRLALPFSRRSVVLGRYVGVAIVALISEFVGIFLASLIACFGFVGSSGSGNLAAVGGSLTSWEAFLPVLILTTVVAASVILALCSLYLPLVMILGYKRGFSFIPVIIISLLCVLPSISGEDLSVLGNQVFGGFFDYLGNLALEGGFAWLGPILLLGIGITLVALLIFSLSAVLTTRVYGRREF